MIYSKTSAWTLVGILVGLAAVTEADYACVCNYGFDVSILSVPRSQSSVLGQLYRSDCKQFVPKGDLDRDWLSIAFRHMIGYVARTGNVQINACAGSPSTDDVITTPSTVSSMPSTTIPASTASPVAASSTSAPSTTAPSTTSSATLSVSSTIPSPTSVSTSASTAATSTTSSKSSTNSANPDGNVNLCPNSLADGDHISGEHGGYCYELITAEKVSWDHAERLCQNKRGYHAHLTSITSPGEQAFLQAFLTRHKPNYAVWIGLHDISIGRHFTWTSGDQVTYTNWLPGRTGNYSGIFDNCVVMVPYKDGIWDDISCGNNVLFGGDSGSMHYTLCKYKAPGANPLQATTLTPNHQVQSGSYMCRTHAHSSSNVIMTQRGDDCYELLLDRKLTWVHGETTCARGGGHLVYIGSAEEQNFLQGFLQTHSADYAVWIGLTDRNSESKSVSYTNWIPGHTSNFHDHTKEDCVVIIPYKEGQWDDIPCGDYDQYGLLVDTGETHYVLCQYKAPGANPLQATTLTPNHQVQSGSYMCRTHAHSSSNVIMTQRGDDCYELLLDRKLTWVHGETTCARGGGHLVYIGSAEEQNFLQGFLQTHSADYAVWIGLTDRNSESKSVSYTNWIPGHTSNFHDHTKEDCVVIIPYKEGQWDDIPCGDYDQYGLLVDTGETHYVLCQYSKLRSYKTPRNCP